MDRLSYLESVDWGHLGATALLGCGKMINREEFGHSDSTFLSLPSAVRRNQCTMGKPAITFGSYILGGIRRCSILCVPNSFKLIAEDVLHIYCTLVWGTTTIGNLNSINLLQKKALRSIANVAYSHTITYLFLKYVSDCECEMFFISGYFILTFFQTKICKVSYIL